MTNTTPENTKKPRATTPEAEAPSPAPRRGIGPGILIGAIAASLVGGLALGGVGGFALAGLAGHPHGPVAVQGGEQGPMGGMPPLPPHDAGTPGGGQQPGGPRN